MYRLRWIPPCRRIYLGSMGSFFISSVLSISITCYIQPSKRLSHTHPPIFQNRPLCARNGNSPRTLEHSTLPHCSHSPPLRMVSHCPQCPIVQQNLWPFLKILLCRQNQEPTPPHRHRPIKILRTPSLERHSSLCKSGRDLINGNPTPW